MTRINTDQPSSGKPLLLYIPSSSNSGFVNTTWQTLAEAPDFSIPVVDENTAVLDPADNSRELRPGEIFIESPLGVTNVTATSQWVELQMLLQGVSGQAIPLTSQVIVPAKETVYLPVQGLRLLKTDFDTTAGGRLQIRGEVNNAFKVMGSAVELEAAQHDPDSEAGL
jgi:hypothetical protein